MMASYSINLTSTGAQIKSIADCLSKAIFSTEKTRVVAILKGCWVIFDDPQTNVRS